MSCDVSHEHVRPPKRFTRKQATTGLLDAILSAAAIAVADDRSVQLHHYNRTTCQSGLTGNAHNYQ